MTESYQDPSKLFHTLEDYALNALNEVNADEQSEELSRIRKNSTALQYYRGLQRGFFDNGGDWNPLDWTKEQDGRAQAVLLSDNIFRPQIKSLIKEWSRSRTDLKVRSRSNSRRTAAASRFASEVIELYQDKIMNESFRQQEGKWSTLCGNYFRYTHLVKDPKRSPKVKVPKTTMRQVVEELYRCVSCAYEIPADQYQGEEVCPECGAGLEHQEGSVSEVPDSYEKVPVGEPQTLLVDPRTVKIPLSTRQLRDHSYLRWTRVDELNRVRRLYKRPDLKAGTQTEVSRYILESERSNGASDSTTNYGLSSQNDSRIEVSYLWLKPDFYYNVAFSENQKVGNLKIQANVPLEEQFPDGILLHICDNKLVDAEQQDLADVWVQGTYDELAETPYGDGNDDAIMDQNRYNELRAMQMENALFNSFSKLVVNTKLLDPSLLENNAEIVPVNQSASIDNDSKLDEIAFAVIPANELSSEISPLVQSIEAAMRAKSGAHLTMSGENDPNVATATGMSILRDAAVATLGLALALRSEVDVEWSYQILEMVQRNWVAEYHSKMCGDYSVKEAEAFAECDIRNDLEITVSANSWIPRTEEQVRADFVGFLTAGGVPLGFANPDLPTEIQQAALDIFRAPVELNKIRPDIRVAEQRIEKLLQFGEELPPIHQAEDLTPEDQEEVDVEYQQIALAIAGKIEVRHYVDEHKVIMNEYRSWLKTDEGQTAHPIIKNAVEILMQRHRDADRMLGMELQNEIMEDQIMQAQGQAEAQAIAPPEEVGAVGKPNAVSPQAPGYQQGKGRVQKDAIAVPQ